MNAVVVKTAGTSAVAIVGPDCFVSPHLVVVVVVVVVAVTEETNLSVSSVPDLPFLLLLFLFLLLLVLSLLPPPLLPPLLVYPSQPQSFVVPREVKKKKDHQRKEGHGKFVDDESRAKGIGNFCTEAIGCLVTCAALLIWTSIVAVSAAAVFDLGNATGIAKDITAPDRQGRISAARRRTFRTASARRPGLRFGDPIGRVKDDTGMYQRAWGGFCSASRAAPLRLNPQRGVVF
ncbi:hypothetical protein E2C01_024427 [Portunus trituberculatus]|uniref:Uncharacterized protein n=1 Tax=Portunus trituberculatus TaxID=210409 RepID=A0A5B7ECA1_PORTR|nr:hypothetical protein [Portunus trituberculatus]